MARNRRDADNAIGGQDEPLLKEMRERWTYATDAWRDIRTEGDKDMRYVSGDPWDAKHRAARDKAGRPCLALDELGQYVNQLINDIRQHKRAIQVTPTGNGANDAKAAFLANLIRQIEYRSNAQQAYTTTFENTVQRSYGFHRIKAKYVSDRSFDQELVIEPIVNADMVTIDPDIQKPDGSDMKFAFIHESWAIRDYKRRWPTAKVTDFDPDARAVLPKSWGYNDQRLQIAEYWTIQAKPRTLLLFKNGQTVFEDELASMPDGAVVVDKREVETPQVCQYLTNGLEILEKHEWPAPSIPLVCCFGKVLYVNDGAGAKKKILSLIRLARDPYMLYCYYRTAEAEQVGMSTKFPYFVRRGALKPDQALKIQESLHQPVAFIEVESQIDGAPVGFVPELPTRNPFEPAIQALEVGAEGARRAIQAAMGGSPLPTSAQRRNEKSGIALKQIEDSAQRGSYHFVDHYEDCVTRTGELLKEAIPFYYDTARDVTVRDEEDNTESVRINDPSQPQEGQDEPIVIDQRDHFDVTLSTGPAVESEREIANEFADTLVGNLQPIAQISGPQAAAKLLSLAVKLKNIGPLGQKMADIIAPPDEGEFSPEQAQAQLAQATKILQALTQQVEGLTRAQETDQIKAQQQMALEQMRQQGETGRAVLKIESEERQHNRELEVKLEIELAKIGSAQSLQRGEGEQQQLHQHAEHEMRREEMGAEMAGAQLERDAAREDAAESRAFEASESQANRDADAASASTP